MIHLILDTNIWIYLATGEHPFILNGINEMLDNNKIVILTNDEIKKEWDRNKQQIKDKTEENLTKQIESTKGLAPILQLSDSKEYTRLLKLISANSPGFRKIFEDRFMLIDKIIKEKSKVIPIKDVHKCTVIDWALNKKAPFQEIFIALFIF